MRIAINALSAVAGGGVTYLNQLFKHLSVIDRNNEYLVITTKKGKKVLYADYKNFCVLSFKIPSISIITRLLWEQVCLWYILKKYKADVLYSPANIGLIFQSFPTIVMIQTVAPFDYEMIKKQNLYYRLKFNLLRILTSLSIKKARNVIFISDKARKELSHYYKLQKDNTSLIYHGRSEIFKPDLDSSRLMEIKQKYGLDEFILYVSNIYKYKNFFELIHAFSLIKEQVNPGLKLALVGKSFDDQYTEALKTLVSSKGLEDRVIFFGHISYEELPYFYAMCRLFLYPSTCENCPNILIEAMACGAPILSSNIEPMPEICQDAAVYFDPFNPRDIAEKIQTTLTNDTLIRDLKRLSLRRASYFSWEDTARKTLQVFEKCK
ncbi:glycosyltransferase family 4 protein [Candidatus Kuenenia stuttgartensis]|uniref:Similar to mannosyltransferase B n=2 Tax=Kuenenia stuttgartiensis TaxID=174633 RepID=Q1PVZ5_KUEST|nr:glycosyltransferase family 1 protein [Candidatus Kuenenia stuttgartiensis]CAJ71390.1 similar to mannosyltransferase B [Candidatus Kuenenia stuttgartiensis]